MKKLTVLSLLLIVNINIYAQGYKIIQTPKTPWHKCWTFVYNPDSVSTRKYPAVLFFHGRGAAGTDSARLIGESLPRMIKAGFIPQATDPVTGKLEKFVVIAPQDPNWSPGPDEMNYIVAWLVKNYKLPIDTNRIYATGLSAGGGRSLMYAVHNPLAVKKVAAVVSMSPASDPDPYIKNFKYIVQDQVPV